jgi:hypothetical protein
MPQTPNYAQYEFLSAATLNAAAGAVSGSLAQIVSGVSAPGLIHPEVLGLAASGLTVTVTAPLPFQTLFGSGIVSSASGVTTGSTSSTYSVNFSGAVPASGSPVTVYLLASYASILEGAYQVVGPPPGHPDYNPLFIPVTAYTSQVDTIAMAASTMAPDNVATFEIARCTLASGATGVGSLSTAYQQRASTLPAIQGVLLSGLATLTPATHGNKTIVFTGSGTATLWPAASGNGLGVTFISTTSGAVTVLASGSDLIYGTTSYGGSTGVSGFTISQGSQVVLESLFGIWQTRSLSPNASGSVTPSSNQTYVAAVSGGVTSGKLAQFSDANGTIKTGPGLSSAQTTVTMVSGATTINSFAQFADATGTVKSGPAPSSAQTIVAMVSGAVTSGNLASFNDATGTVVDSGLSPGAVNATGSAALYQLGLLL